MARILRLSVVHLGRLAKQGILPQPVMKGRWDVVATVHAYLKYRDETKKKEDPSDDVKSEEMKLLIARRHKTEAEHEAQAMKNAQLRAGLLDADEVQREWSNVLRGVRARMLALPTQVQQRLPHLTAHDVEELDRAIRLVLEEASGDAGAG